MRLYLRPIYHNIIYNTTIAEAEYTSDFELTKTPKVYRVLTVSHCILYIIIR